MKADFLEAFLYMTPSEQQQWIEIERKMEMLKRETEERSAEHERMYMLRLRFYERWALQLATWLMSRLPRY